MQDAPKAVWSILYISVAFFQSLKHNCIAYRSSKMSDCIFEIHRLWQSGLSRVYSNSCCSCSFKSEVIKIGQSSHKMYSNNTLNFQVSTTNLNACTKKSGNLLKAPRIINYKKCKAETQSFSSSIDRWAVYERTTAYFILFLSHVTITWIDINHIAQYELIASSHNDSTYLLWNLALDWARWLISCIW